MSQYKQNYRIIKYSLLMLMVFITACGGEGGSSSAPESNQANEGVFVDSAVSGLRFETNTLSGLTDADGTFSYATNEVVNFYVGDILLGSSTGKAVITPIDLVPGAINATNPTVTNILRFIQALDDDDNPSNGIVITPAVANLAIGKTVNFDQSIADFENDGDMLVILAELSSARSTGARLLVDVAVAQTNLLIALGNVDNGNNDSGGSLSIINAPSSVGGNFAAADQLTVQEFTNNNLGITWTEGGASAGLFEFINVGIDAATPNVFIVTFAMSKTDSLNLNFTQLGAGGWITNEAIWQCIDFNVQNPCEGVTANLNSGELTFDNLVLFHVPLAEGEQAQDPITLNGILNFSPLGAL